MENGLALLRLALERGWSLGLLFLVFSGGALAAAHFGVELPTLVKQWAAVGVLFGVAAIVVSLAANLVALASRVIEERARRRADAAEQEAEARQVRASVEALTVDNAVALARILSSGAERFQVDILSDGYPLVQMGLLIIERSLGGTRWICRLHPALAPQREELARHLGVQLNRLSQTR